MTERATAAAIRIRHLWKVFGPHPERHLAALRAGLSKEELNRRHGHVLGLSDISLDIPARRITVVMGLSGSGKSTLVRHLNGLVRPTAGEILCDGADLCRLTPGQLRAFRRHRVAMVFQRFALLPHRTVLGNVCYGLDIRGVPRRQSLPVARRWIARVGLEGFEGAWPAQLSGGMQQRVGLARALATEADILLMDEAFSALDPLIRVDMQAILLELQRELGRTVVFITHDLDEALRLGDRIAILRDGRLEQEGSPQEIVLRPANAHVAAFVREVRRGQVLRLATVARPLPPDAPPPSLRLPGTLVLDEAARRLCAAGAETAGVLDEAGRPSGIIAASDLLFAMVATPSDR